METLFDWEWARVGDLISRDGIFRDGDWVESKDQDPEGDVRLIQLADIGDGVYNDRSSRFLTHSKAQELKCTFLRKGDLLIARMPDPLGRSCVFPGDPKRAVTVVDACIVRTSSHIGHNWLMYIINSPQSRKKIAALQTGSTRKRISRKNLAAIEFPVPPLVEQRAIVAKIEQLFSGLDSGIEQLQKIKQQLKQYRQAVLKAAFEGKLTAEWRAEQQAKGNLPDAGELLEQIKREREERYQQQLKEWKQAVTEWEAAGGKNSGRKKPSKPARLRFFEPTPQDELPSLGELPSGWIWVPLSVLGDLSRGKSRHRPRNSPHLYGGPYPFIQTGDVRAANRVVHKYTQTYSEAGLAQSRMWLAGTLCITIAANIAESAFLGFDGCFPDSVVGFITFESLINGDYVQFFLESAKSRIAALAPATAQKNINLATLESLVVPYCSPAEQMVLIAEIESRLSVLDELEKAVDQGLAQADALRQSILKKAFEGRLLSDAELTAVRNDPEYEPADRLLERIKAERKQDKQSSRAKPTRKGTRRKALSGPQRDDKETAGEVNDTY